MHLLGQPVYSIEDFYDEMLIGRHDNEKNSFLRTRLVSIKQELLDKEEIYLTLARKTELHTLSEQYVIDVPPSAGLDDSIPKIIDDKEMEKVYSNFLVEGNSEKIGRKVYESIKANTYFNLCPYCSHREVKTVDHFLPKSKFMSFAVTPINLVPCCSDCNKDKLDDYNLTEDKMLIHPYFDDISSISWLDCKVNEGIWPITFSFQVENSITDPIIKSRVNYQFNKLNLGKLYADNATREFNKRVKSLVKEYISDPSDRALRFLNDNYESYKFENLNSWQTKMFKALIESKWFLDEALPNLKRYYNKN